MRGIFGLAGVLVVLGVIVWFMSRGGLDNMHQTVKTGNAAREQVNQIAGNDPETGERASQSVVLETVGTGGRVDALLVARLTPGGAYEKYFGLQRNDTIVASEYQGVRQDLRGANDVQMAKAQVEEAFRRQGSVYVKRDGKDLKLPAAPAAGQAPRKDSLQQQIDSIQGLPR